MTKKAVGRVLWLLTMYIRIKVQLDLQVDKSSAVVKGQMCDARINLIKPRTLIFKDQPYASNIESITKTNLIDENRT
jgi:hypothetical protein